MLKIMDPSTLLPDFSAEHATDAALQAELAELFARISVLAEQDDAGLARGRARLLSAVSESGERFAPLFGKLMQFFDLSADALRALFIRAASEHEWQAGPLPWVSLFHFQGGPRVAALDTGLVRLKKGMPFPRHRHTGAERVLVLEGGYHDHEQRFYGPGALHDMAQGSEHSLQMNAERDVLLAVILSGEIQVISG
jgi:quercetin dioxygenase-like cupin family protein